MNVHGNAKVCLASLNLVPMTMQRMTIKSNALMMAAYVNVRYLQVLQEHVSFGGQTAFDCTNTSQKVTKMNSLLYPNCSIYTINKYFFNSTIIV